MALPGVEVETGSRMGLHGGGALARAVPVALDPHGRAPHWAEQQLATQPLKCTSIHVAALTVFLAHVGILAWHVHADHAWTCLDAWSHGAASTCTTRAGTGTALMLTGPMLSLVSIALHDPRLRADPPPALPPRNL